MVDVVNIEHSIVAPSLRGGPATSQPDPLPVLLLLHGYGADERDLLDLAPQIAPTLPWASVRAPLPLPYGGASWFPIDDLLAAHEKPRLDAAPVMTATHALWEWIDDVLGNESVVVPVGFSQGGLMASQLLRTRPSRVLAPVILSGFILDQPLKHDDELSQSKPAVFWGRGDNDPIIAEFLVHQTASRLTNLATLTTHVYPGMAHSICQLEISHVRDFIAEHGFQASS